MNFLNIPFHLNPRLICGLYYYGETAFEIISDQATICGCGRWMQGTAASPTTEKAPELYLVTLGEVAEGIALNLARQLCADGVYDEIDCSGAAFAK